MIPLCRHFKIEFARAFFSFNMYLSLGIGFLCLWIGGLEVLMADYTQIDFVTTFMYAQTSGTSSLLGLAFPLLACLPFMSTYLEEIQTGYMHNVIMKINKKGYLLNKIIVTGLSGGFAIGMPCLIYALCCIFIKGNLVLAEQSGVTVSFFKELYFKQPLVYTFMLVWNGFVCGSIFAILGLGLSALIKNKYISTIVPFAFYIFSAIVLVQINIRLNAVTLFSLNEYNSASPIGVVLYDGFLFFSGILCLLIGEYKDEK